jgi:putative ABC transport system ATP-binding protein
VNDQFICTEDLCRYYIRGPQQVRAVDKVSLQVEAHEFLALVGASGSGKSTILNLLAGLDTPTSGKIVCSGKILSSLSRKGLAEYRAQKVGMMFQSFNLIHHRSALENVELALFFNNTLEKERRVKASAILDRLGLSDRITHKPSDLSGGEQQRVALARALVKNPEILFADEPTGNLDQENAQQIMAMLTDLNRQGLTIIMVTHDIEMAKKYAHRIIRMQYGRIVDTIHRSERGNS